MFKPPPPTTLYWDPTQSGGTNLGGSSPGVTWNSNAAWYNGTSDVAWTNGDIAVFEGTGAKVTVSSPVTVDGMTFGCTSYDIQGSTITLAAPAGSNTATITANYNARIDSAITGPPPSV